MIASHTGCIGLLYVTLGYTGHCRTIHTRKRHCQDSASTRPTAEYFEWRRSPPDDDSDADDDVLARRDLVTRDDVTVTSRRRPNDVTEEDVSDDDAESDVSGRVTSLWRSDRWEEWQRWTVHWLQRRPLTREPPGLAGVLTQISFHTCTSSDV